MAAARKWDMFRFNSRGIVSGLEDDRHGQLSQHLIDMRTDFNVFRERLAEACRVRKMTAAKLSSSTGLAPRRTLAARLTGPGSLDLYRVCQIADLLDVSVDWLTARSNVMDVLELPEAPKKTPKKA
jgi:hypothetical protein